MSKKSGKSGKALPRIYKQTEFDLMLEMIQSGLYKTVNLVNALHVDEDTIAKWKRRPEAIAAHRKAILKFVKRRTDVEKILKELELESDRGDDETKPLVIIKHGDSTIEVAN